MSATRDDSDFAVTWQVFDPVSGAYIEPAFRSEPAAERAASRIPGATVEMVIPDRLLAALARRTKPSESEAELLAAGMAKAAGAGIREALNRAVGRMEYATQFHEKNVEPQADLYSRGFAAAMRRAVAIIREELG